WDDGQETDATLTPLAGGGYSFLLPRGFETAGTVSAEVTIFDSDGVSTVLQTHITISPDPNRGFLAKLYEDLLGRQVDPTGSQGWLGALAQGSPREQIINGIQSSPEYEAHVINQLYQEFLGRAADSVGLQDFGYFMSQGGTLAQVKA